MLSTSCSIACAAAAKASPKMLLPAIEAGAVVDASRRLLRGQIVNFCRHSSASMGRCSWPALAQHMRGLAHAVPSTQPLALAQWPLLVANFGDRGRGLIADRDIAQGQHVLCEHFFVCAPHQRPEPGLQQEAADTATVLHTWPPAAQLDARMQREGRHFPRLVLRIAENILADFVRDPRANAQASWGRVRELCRPKIADIPPAWRQDFHAVRQAMVGDASPSSSKVEVKADDPLLPCNPVLFDMLFSPDWYAQVMGICHLNSFCVPRPPSAADPAPPGTVGGLFLTASLFNHSCANNIAPAWVDQETDRGGNGAPYHGDVLEGRAAPGLATLRQPNMCFIATRDIAQGEECKRGRLAQAARAAQTAEVCVWFRLLLCHMFEGNTLWDCLVEIMLSEGH